MPDFETIIYKKQDSVATITMNRPERRNAMNLAMNSELLDAFELTAADEEVRAVLVTGAGKGFCSGADLTMFQPVPTPEQLQKLIISNYQPMMAVIKDMQKPVIAAVNGAAAGAGASLALACDLRVMAHDASLLMAFSNIALIPDAGANWLMTRLVGYSRAYEIAVEGHQIPAERCLELGLTNKVVPADQLSSIAFAWAMKLAQRPTLALGLTKQAMQYAGQNDLASTIEFEADLQRQTIVSEDFLEGVMAFMQKREPLFRGR
ncbi:MAG: enoyl-CoA hydratase-related protein [Candidatus Promineifilaceae bacterium]|nr:enoyl-CoA hydratase-related protein [Candidatus Promineifilaceae bacterium]